MLAFSAGQYVISNDNKSIWRQLMSIVKVGEMHNVSNPWFAVLGPIILWILCDVELAYLSDNTVVFAHKIACLPICELEKLAIFGKPVACQWLSPST